jgi:heparosan-N-sulfate-glucuronate 5-epimerase
MRLPLLLAVLGILGVLSFPAPARADVGPYLDTASWTRIDDHVVIGPEGVPRVPYYWGLEDNPVTVAQWALQHWSWYSLSGRQADLDAAITAADWFVAHQRADGAWVYDFDFNGAGVRLRAPWISAMAQGQAMSLLVRAYSVTSDARYLDAAKRALVPFETSVEDGGVLADFDGVTWFEEYPTTPAQHVLNGFQFTLIGLHDLADHSPEAQVLWEQGVASLVARIGVFDAPESHSQWYAALGAGRMLVNGSYPRIHAVLTREIHRFTGEQTLDDWATKWEDYLDYRPPAAARAPRTAPAPVVPELLAPAPPSVAAVPAVKPRARPCRYRDWPLRTLGALSCVEARRVIAQYVRRGTPPRRWTCHTGSRAICRRGTRRVSAAVPRAVRQQLRLRGQ